MQGTDVQAKVAAAQVLTGLYLAIADHTQFDGMLSAMDDFLDAEPDGLETGTADWQKMFREHFHQASLFLNQMPMRQSVTPIVFVDKQVVPAAVIDDQFSLLASNKKFDEINSCQRKSLSDAFATPDDKRRLSSLKSVATPLQPVLISLILEEGADPVFVVASKGEQLELPGKSTSAICLKVAKATWNEDLEPLLTSAYSLTPAEIDVLSMLVSVGSLNAVAKRRSRSIRTVRTQLAHIYGKLGLNSQTELALFLATLSQLMTNEGNPSEVGEDWGAEAHGEISYCTTKRNGRNIAYLKYGDPNGRPVLMIHSTTPPDLTPTFRQACAEAGLLVLGVHKPGSGGTDPRPPTYGPSELVPDSLAVLEAEKIPKAVFAGHCSAGLYALKLAHVARDKCSGVLLIDTGFPFEGSGSLMALPKSFRRTMLPARFFPEILLVPHQIFAANFKRSSEGEAQVVDYFFQDNPRDRDLTRTDRTYYEITRRIIAYSFEDVDRLVADISRWAQDWSNELKFDQPTPITFLHGDQNALFSISKIREFVKTHENAKLVCVKDEGQLQLYRSPEKFVEAVASIPL